MGTENKEAENKVENTQITEKTPAAKFVGERDSNTTSFWPKMNAYKSPEIIFTGPQDAAKLEQYVGATADCSVVPDAILDSGSWRSKSVNGVVDVDPRIVLVTEKTEYSEGYQFETGALADMQDSGAMKTLKNVVEGVNGAINAVSDIMNGTDAPTMPEDSFISRYTGMRYLKGIQSQGINEMTYKFRMGSSGIFNAYKEVVEPIVALICCFAPVRDPANPGFLKGPAPTKSTLVSEIAKLLYKKVSSSEAIQKGNADYSSLYDNDSKKKEDSSVSSLDYELYEKYWNSSGWGVFSSKVPNTATYGEVTVGGKKVEKYDKNNAEEVKAVVEAVKKFLDSGDEAKAKVRDESNKKIAGASEFLKDIENAIMTTLNEAAQNMMHDGRLTVCSFKIGHMLYGPYFAGNINWAFDYSQVDGNGWPYAGYVQISDLKPLLLMERYDIANRLINSEYVAPTNNGKFSLPLNITGYHTASPYGDRWVPTAGTSSQYWYKSKEEFEIMYKQKKLKKQFHGGIDLSHATCYGDSVFPIYEGKIVYADNSKAYGNCVIIKHTGEFDTYMSLYAHLQSLEYANTYRQYNNGMVVKSSCIGLVGGTNSYSPHLHFSIFRCGANETSACPGDSNYNNRGEDPARHFVELDQIVKDSKINGHYWEKDGASG